MPFVQAYKDVCSLRCGNTGPALTASGALPFVSRVGCGLRRILVQRGAHLWCFGIAALSGLIRTLAFVRLASGCFTSAFRRFLASVFYRRRSFLLTSFSSTIASIVLFRVHLHTEDAWLVSGYRTALAAAVLFIHAFLVSRESVWLFPRKILLYTSVLLFLVPS
ncbi:hypothetical protein CSUI_005405, partial [Cystoisospora suis]